MNSRSSIHPPPDMLWQDLGVDKLIDRFNEEADAPASRHDSGIGVPSSTSSSVPVSTSTNTLTSTTTTSEGTFGRLSRAVSSFFHASTFAGQSKRKLRDGETTVNTPAPPADDRREQAQRAYEQAKEFGLLPTPKVFVRPQARARRSVPGTPLAPPSIPPSRLNTPTRTLNKSASKKDLNKQKKLSKRVSNLEHKLSEARKELGLALAHKEKENELNRKLFPPVSPIQPLTPTKTHVFTGNEGNPVILVESSPNSHNKMTKKRKSSDAKAVSIYEDGDVESEHESKKSKKMVTPRRQSTRLRKARSTSSMTTITKEEVMMVVPDGALVPPIPVIPAGTEGKRVPVQDDGFGGLGHEIF